MPDKVGKILSYPYFRGILKEKRCFFERILLVALDEFEQEGLELMLQTKKD